jgi:hypothetical protein
MFPARGTLNSSPAFPIPFFLTSRPPYINRLARGLQGAGLHVMHLFADTNTAAEPAAWSQPGDVLIGTGVAVPDRSVCYARSQATHTNSRIRRLTV